MTSFIYTPTAEDYLAFEKFKKKKNKTFFFNYLFCVMFVATAAYDAFITKDKTTVIYAVIIAVLYILVTLSASRIGAKNRVKNMISKDMNYITPNEVIIDEKTIEFKNIPRPNQTGVIGVYPYSIMNVIYETEEYYYFFLGTEVKILPKRAIPQENKEYVKKTIRKNRNYLFVK